MLAEALPGAGFAGAPGCDHNRLLTGLRWLFLPPLVVIIVDVIAVSYLPGVSVGMRSPIAQLAATLVLVRFLTWRL